MNVMVEVERVMVGMRLGRKRERDGNRKTKRERQIGERVETEGERGLVD